MASNDTTESLTPEQIIMIVIFVAIPLGLIGLILLMMGARCCGYSLRLNKINEGQSLSAQKSTIDDALQDICDKHAVLKANAPGAIADGDEDVEAADMITRSPPSKRYSLVRFSSNKN
jgi:hypothetical protein